MAFSLLNLCGEFKLHCYSTFFFFDRKFSQHIVRAFFGFVVLVTHLRVQYQSMDHLKIKTYGAMYMWYV